MNWDIFIAVICGVVSGYILSKRHMQTLMQLTYELKPILDMSYAQRQLYAYRLTGPQAQEIMQYRYHRWLSLSISLAHEIVRFIVILLILFFILGVGAAFIGSVLLTILIIVGYTAYVLGHEDRESERQKITEQLAERISGGKSLPQSLSKNSSVEQKENFIKASRAVVLSLSEKIVKGLNEAWNSRSSSFLSFFWWGIDIALSVAIVMIHWASIPRPVDIFMLLGVPLLIILSIQIFFIPVWFVIHFARKKLSQSEQFTAEP